MGKGVLQSKRWMNKYLFNAKLESWKMPRSKESNRQIREERRTQIIEVAARVFAQRGFGATRISDIAEAAEMSQGLIYRYFASKEEIFGVLIECTSILSQQLAEEVLAQNGSAWEKLVWITEKLLALQFGEPVYSLNILQTYANTAIPTNTREICLTRSKILMDAVRQLISAGQTSGHVKPTDPDQLTFLYFATMQGLAVAAAFLEQPAAGYPSSETVLAILKN